MRSVSRQFRKIRVFQLQGCHLGQNADIWPHDFPAESRDWNKQLAIVGC